MLVYISSYSKINLELGEVIIYKNIQSFFLFSLKAYFKLEKKIFFCFLKLFRLVRVLKISNSRVSVSVKLKKILKLNQSIYLK